MVAIMPVALDKKFPADLEDIKLSCPTPIPKAPPSYFCNKITTTKRIAEMTFIANIIFSMIAIYSNFLLYQ